MWPSGEPDRRSSPSANILRDREAVLFYVSDHGESLGEIDERGQAHWNHGENQRIEQRIVPMQAWASDRFIAKYPDRFAALKRRATTPLSHDHFFHSVLDCIGIHSDAVDKHLSVCSTQRDFTEREKSSGELTLGAVSSPSGDHPTTDLGPLANYGQAFAELKAPGAPAVGDVGGY